MATEPGSRVFALAARDLVFVLAATEAFAPLLDGFARRRAARYATADHVATDESWWQAAATDLAPVGPPEGMPMAGLIAAGVTLEGGAKGLRGLFTSTPSEKHRKRVARIAALAARVMNIVGGADNTLTDDERRGIEMAMASFGLPPDELASIRPTGKLTPAQLEIFGELDAKVRRELVRGAWHVHLRGPAKPADEETVMAVSTKLDLADQSMAIRSEVETLVGRLGDTAALAVELTRVAGALLPSDKLRPSVDHLIRAMAPPSRAAALRVHAASTDPVAFEPALKGLDRGRRVQAIALAWTTLVATDPNYSTALSLRAALTTAAGEAGAAYEVTEAVDAVDRFLRQRVSEARTPEPTAST